MNTSSILKTVLYRLVVFLEKSEQLEKYTDSIVRFFSLLLPVRREKFMLVTVAEVQESTRARVLATSDRQYYAAKPQYFYQSYELEKYSGRATYSALITNAKIFGSSNVVLFGGNTALYDLHSCREREKFKYSDAVIYKSIGDKLLLHYKEGGGIEKGIMLSGNFAWNYYHFMFEFLPRFLLLDALHLPKDIPLIVDEVVKTVPQLGELLAYFNANSRDVVYIKPARDYRVGELYYLSLLNLVPPNYENLGRIKVYDYLFNPDSISFLRSTLLQKKGGRRFGDKIFLSRRNASSRRKYNENDVEELFGKHGFEVVHPEVCSVSDQISLFYNAQFIAGVTGAAFANIVFCSRNCKILCIEPVKYELSAFSTVAKYLRLDLQYLAVEDSFRLVSDVHEAFEVDLGRVEEVLIHFLRR